MWRRVAFCVLTPVVVCVIGLEPRLGWAQIFHRNAPPPLPSLVDVAHLVDKIESDILNQGTVVIKQPDVWSQARMTKFRKEFEDTMALELNKFETRLSARIARSDAAAFSSQTALGASLTPLAQGQRLQLADMAAVTTERNNAINGIISDPNNANQQTVIFPNPFANFTTPGFPLLNNFIVPADASQPLVSGMPFGLEPNIQLDQQADYITHLHRIRRVNLGDDNADSAGYGLYLIRVPVSIQPGDRTVRGHGAVVTLTMQHDFGPGFLSSTYRNLVINDVIDKLSGPVHELIRAGTAMRFHDGGIAIPRDVAEANRRLQTLNDIIASQYPESGITFPLLPTPPDRFSVSYTRTLPAAISEVTNLHVALIKYINSERDKAIDLRRMASAAREDATRRTTPIVAQLQQNIDEARALNEALADKMVSIRPADNSIESPPVNESVIDLSNAVAKADELTRSLDRIGVGGLAAEPRRVESFRNAITDLGNTVQGVATQQRIAAAEPLRIVADPQVGGMALAGDLPQIFRPAPPPAGAERTAGQIASRLATLNQEIDEQLRTYTDAQTSIKRADTEISVATNAEREARGVEDFGKDLNRSSESVREAVSKITESFNTSLPVSRTGTRVNAVGPTDVNQVFIPENLLDLAFAAQVALGLGRSPKDPNAPILETWKVRLTDVRSFLRHELEAAYDILDTPNVESMPLLMDVPYVESVIDQVTSRRFEATKGAEPNSLAELNELSIVYEAFANRLPGNLRRRSLGALAWAIVVEGGLLNRQLRQDMLETKGEGYSPPADVEGFFFYTPVSTPDAEFAFQEYIKARWPMITFALEPVTDQQNIEDAFTRRRDLQLAVAFALSSGRISFRQAIQFTRQLQYEAQTIALNQTVTAFAHANDTFGWRFSPRYQTPPEESNFQAIGNLLGRGGPGPNYQIKNSKIEPGLRELTAVVVMPSFVRGVRFDVSTDWFKLHDPDERKVSTVHTINLGHRINEARQALAQAESCGMHRPEDIQRLSVRLLQLERMLPMQTSHVKVPYENTLGGFALFTQGVTALVPELTGFEGIEYLEKGDEPNTAKGADLLIYGKHFSIYEMEVVSGGKALLREGTGTAVLKNQEETLVVGTTISPLRKTDGNLVIFKADGSTEEIKDVGTYNIVSREVLRVRLPDDMATARREDGQEIVEFYVSTPNGISNRLQIPVRPAPVVVRPAFSTPAQGQSYLLPTDRLTIPINAHIETAGSEPIAHGVGEIPFDQTLTFKPTLTTDPMPPAINARFVFVGTANTLLPPIDLTSIPFDEGTGLYVMGASHIEELATSLFKQVIDNNLAIAPTTTAQTSRIAVAPQPGNTAFGTLNQLTVGFEFTLAVPPATTANPPAESAMLRASFNQPSFATAPTPEAAASSILPPLPTPGRLSPASPGGQAPVVLPAAFRPVQDTTTPAAPQGGQVAAPTATAPQAAAVPGPQPAPAAQPFPQGFADAAALLSRAAASQPPTVMVLPQRAPIVNVEVPITNESPKRHGLFHREPISPSNPARRPILERLRGQF